MLRQTVPELSPLPDEVLDRFVLEVFFADITREQIGVFADLMVEHDFTEARPDVDALMPDIS